MVREANLSSTSVLALEGEKGRQILSTRGEKRGLTKEKDSTTQKQSHSLYLRENDKVLKSYSGKRERGGRIFGFEVKVLQLIPFYPRGGGERVKT